MTQKGGWTGGRGREERRGGDEVHHGIITTSRTVFHPVQAVSANDDCDMIVLQAQKAGVANKVRHLCGLLRPDVVTKSAFDNKLVLSFVIAI